MNNHTTLSSVNLGSIRSWWWSWTQQIRSKTVGMRLASVTDLLWMLIDPKRHKQQTESILPLKVMLILRSDGRNSPKNPIGTRTPSVKCTHNLRRWSIYVTSLTTQNIMWKFHKFIVIIANCYLPKCFIICNRQMQYNCLTRFILWNNYIMAWVY